MRKRLLYIGLFILSYRVISFGYEDDLYQHFSIRDTYHPYNLLNNPALLRLTGQKDWMMYRFYTGNQKNGYRRTFDPEGVEIGGMEFFSYKVLDEKSTLASRIVFETTEQKNLYRSLEKDFYRDYFAYTDTTTGNISYAGPRLNVVYSHAILSRFSVGIHLDYGIERGLKDVYTKCETVARNINIQWGFAYCSLNGASLGASVRYFDRQGTYEAVKEISDAVVNTYMGYHIYYPEQPRSKNEKKADNRGMEIDAQFTKEGFLLSGLKIDLAGGYGEMENCIDAGSTNKPTRRGYWVRKGGFVNSILSFGKNPQSLGLVFMAGVKRYYDWASPRDYHVINIENDLNDVHYGMKMIIPLSTSNLTLGYEAGTEAVNYREYTADFVFNETLSRNRVFSDLDIRINQVTDMYYGVWVSNFEPLFYWNTRLIQAQGIEMGLERLFVFGKLGASLQMEFWKPEDKTGAIKQFGIAVSYQK